MGWFKKVFGFSTPKIFKKAEDNVKKVARSTGLDSLSTDDFLPEDIKGLDIDDFIPESLGKPSFADDGIAGDVGDPTGNLDDKEAAEAARKRLSRIGKFFTSVLGDTSKAKTGSQRVFS
jgi:hypothetical protein